MRFIDRLLSLAVKLARLLLRCIQNLLPASWTVCASSVRVTPDPASRRCRIKVWQPPRSESVASPAHALETLSDRLAVGLRIAAVAS